MRAAAILGPGNVSKYVMAFQRDLGVQWVPLIEQPDAVVVFGGDGTVHHHLATVVERDVPLLVVPCGSGNDFARALRLRTVPDSMAAWENFSEGATPVREIDLGLVRSLAGGAPAPHYFCCVAGIGIDTQITDRANKLPRWLRSRGGYFFSAAPEFLRFAPFPMAVSCNGTRATAFRPMVLAAVANAPAYGGGMKIAPHAKLDDGMLDVCLVAEMDVWKLFCLFPTVYFGRHLGFAEVEYTQAPDVRVETEHPLDVYADGEFVCKTPVEFSIARGALKVIAPSDER